MMNTIFYNSKPLSIIAAIFLFSAFFLGVALPAPAQEREVDVDVDVDNVVVDGRGRHKHTYKS